MAAGAGLPYAKSSDYLTLGLPPQDTSRFANNTLTALRSRPGMASKSPFSKTVSLQTAPGSLMNQQTVSAEGTVVLVVFVLIAVSGIAAFARWIMRAPSRPDPWDAEPKIDVNSLDARPLCTRCLCQLEETDWFCSDCGKAASPTTNMMPFLDSLSLGDVLRQGTDGRIRTNLLSIAGYMTLAITHYLIFAPIYWWRLFRNIRRQRLSEENHIERTLGDG